MNLRYNIYTKYTSVYDDYNGDWVYGCQTQQVDLKDAEIDQYYVTDAGGKRKTSIKTFNNSLITANYNYPAPKAVQWMNKGWVEDVKYTIYGATVKF